MKTYKFRISTQQKVKLSADVEKFNKLADKLSCPRAVLNTECVSVATSPHHKTNTIVDISWHLPHTKFHDCELTVSTIIAGDYTFIGAIHYDSKSDMTDIIPFVDTVKFEDSYTPTCDECNTGRKRKITYLVQSNVDASILQIGSSCMRDFCGYSAANLLNALKFSTKFSNIGSNYQFDPMLQTSKMVEYGIKEIFMLANAVIRVYGWHPGRSETHIPTSDVVKQICNQPESKEGAYWLTKVQEYNKTNTDENIANEISKWIRTDTSSSDYMSQLRRVINMGTVSTNHFNMICSAVNSFKNSIKWKLEAQSAYNNNYVGVVGERMVFELRCIETKIFNNEYGESTLYKMIDKEDHLFVWFSSSALKIPKDAFLRVKGTIKKHEEFNHAKQTVLTRVARVK